jgi:type IV fimbrial biogenesis protein FimT
MRRAGFTLTGLLVALAIVAVVAAMAAPSFERVRRQWAVARSAQSLLAAMHQARSIAALRGLPTVLCQTDAPSHCTLAAGARMDWQLFAAGTVSSPPRFNAGDELLQLLPLPGDVEVRTGRTALSWWPAARAGTTATLVVCDRRGLAAPRVLIVSQSGRPRLGTRLSDGSMPDCGPA